MTTTSASASGSASALSPSAPAGKRATGALTSSHNQPPPIPPTTTTTTKTQRGNSIILHFDYDCFYASVFENQESGLRTHPLGVQQKSILATCNYAARARGVKKLMSVAGARRICPDLVLRNGEDLTPFRDASRRLWGALFERVGKWEGHVGEDGVGRGKGRSKGEIRMERLGLDEVFVDATEAVAYNLALLNPNVSARQDSFFHLSPTDPEDGFAFDGTTFCGGVYPSSPSSTTPGKQGKQGEHGTNSTSAVPSVLDHTNPTHIRLMLGSHLAGHLRRMLESDFGYTSSCGISTNKVLAKLAGSVNKPRNQTTLVPIRIVDQDKDTVQDFLDAHPIRKIPGIGSRIRGLIYDHMVKNGQGGPENPLSCDDLTVRDVLHHPAIASSAQLSRILDRPGLERGIGAKVWGLLHGVDPSEVKKVAAETSDPSATPIPTQISVEDTYMARPLNSVSELVGALNGLAEALVGRLWGDLTTTATTADTGNGASQTQSQKRWLARPRTLRLSTHVHPRFQPRPSTTTTTNHNFSRSTRSTRSQPLPTFILDLALDKSAIADRLVREALLPLFRRLHVERQGWNLAMLNVGVSNMVIVAADGDSTGSGAAVAAATARNISWMFRTQEEKLREWTAYNDGDYDDGNDNHNGSSSSEKRGYDSSESPPQAPFSHHPNNNDNTTTNTKEEDSSSTMDADHAHALPAERKHPPSQTENIRKGIIPFTDDNGIGSGIDITVYDDSDWGEDNVWEENDEDDDVDHDDGDNNDKQRCPLCGIALPIFAMSAHERFHAMGD